MARYRGCKFAMFMRPIKPMSSSPDLSITQRIVRFEDMEPCKTAFIDARTPGSDQKENFCLIGAGVAENPDQVVHIAVAHGFDIGAARQPKGCKNSHHSHDTEEVFVIHKGDWQFTWGERGEQGQVVLSEGDTISLPTRMFRGFENVGADDGMIFSVLGLNEDGTAGHVVWAPYVYEAAAEHGLVLLEDGRLIDTAAGASIPEDGVPAAPSTSAELAGYPPRSLEEMQARVMRADELKNANKGGLSAFEGIQEIAVIGCDNAAEKIAAGKMSWPHRFSVRRLLLDSGANVPPHARHEEEVLIVQAGELRVVADGEDFVLKKGDLFTTPVGCQRSFSNPASSQADIIVVRRGDQPTAASFS